MNSFFSHPNLRKTAIVLAAVLLLLIGAFCICRRTVAHLCRAAGEPSLDGYRVTIGSLDFHPVGFSIDLENVKLVQTGQPDQPILRLPFWTRERALARIAEGAVSQRSPFRTAGDACARALRPQKEVDDDQAFMERGWQEAVLSHLSSGHQSIEYFGW